MGCLPFTTPLRYHPAADDFAPYAPLPDSFLLDSSLTAAGQGRFSFWGYKPKLVLESCAGFVTLAGHTTIQSPVAALKDLYQQKIIGLPTDPYFPFCGGLVGFVGYEWGAALENIAPAGNGHDLITPDCRFGLYDTIVGYDHLEKIAWVSSLGLDDNLECNAELAQERSEKLAEHIEYNRRIELERANERTSGREHSREFRSSLDRDAYLRAAGRVLDYLRAGDCYQVNLTQRFMAASDPSPWNQFLKLREVSPAPYSCFLNAGSFQILSSSPESFLEADRHGRLTTRPIKGTRPRGAALEEDRKLKEELLYSAKDNAELLMITDLERNDLGKVCVPGSIQVWQLQTVESFAQVHHLFSIICGQRKPECDIIDCLAACSPGGSITGAPKIRSMEIIRELEPVQRGVYTGSIGWIGPQNTAHLNIAIRTMVLQDGTAYFNAGGGIVIDSDPESEYLESLAKAKGMMAALGLC